MSKPNQTSYLIQTPCYNAGPSTLTRQENYAVAEAMLGVMFSAALNDDLPEEQIACFEADCESHHGDLIRKSIGDMALVEIPYMNDDLVHDMVLAHEEKVIIDSVFIGGGLLFAKVHYCNLEEDDEY